MKQKFILCALFVAMAVTATADWWETDRIVRGGLEGLGAILASQERQQQAEIFSREKARYEADFNDAYSQAKELEAAGEWERALEEYEQAATLNCQYGYTDQKAISKKITSLYSKAGRDDDGPSILNNSQITLADYSVYRYMQLNPICKVDDKVRNAKILRVACSDTETRLEIEGVASSMGHCFYIKPDAYIKGNKGGKLQLIGVDNITLYPVRTIIPFPYQTIRFALIFEPLPPEATEFEFIVPKSDWKFKKIRCK